MYILKIKLVNHFGIQTYLYLNHYDLNSMLNWLTIFVLVCKRGEVLLSNTFKEFDVGDVSTMYRKEFFVILSRFK